MIIAIVGPTGVGKTKLSIALAQKLNGEIINADSVSLYKGLDIGSAKPTKEEQKKVVHHLIDINMPNEEYTIYNYQKDCRRKIKEIKDKGKTPILVGGSGLYLKAALYNYDLKEENNKIVTTSLTNEQIYEELKQKYPQIVIDQNNRQRLIRAYSKLKNNIPIEKQNPKPYYKNIIIIGLKTDNKILYERINNRVLNMFPNLLDEVKNLYQKYPESKILHTAIGYKELIDYLENKTSFEQSIELIQKNSRHYAKRQYTFFRHQFLVNWLNVDYQDFNKTINEALSICQKFT